MRDNEGISAMAFLFIVPLLFVIGCFILDFVIIYKEKSKLNDNMEYIIALYEDGNTSRILAYSHENNFKANYVKEENGDIKFTLKKEIELKTPVGKHILGSPYKLEVTKTKKIEAKVDIKE